MYTDFVCGDVPLTEYLEPTPPVSIYPSFLTSIPSSSQTSTSPSRTLAAPTNSSIPSNGLSTGQISGIAVGGGILVSFVTGLLMFFCLRRRRKRSKNFRLGLQRFPPPTSGGLIAENPDTEFKDSTLADSLSPSPQYGLTAKPDTLLSCVDFKNSIIFRLICLYGDEGVPLRELVELIYVRFALSRANELYFDYPPCSRSIEHMFRVGVTPPLISAFLQAVAEPEKFRTLEQQLVTFGVIRVIPDRNVEDYTRDSCLGQKQGLWTVDCRIWQPQNVVEDIDNDRRFLVLQCLLDFFDGMPDKTSHHLAERYREVYYNHGHAFSTHMVSLYRKATPKWDLIEQRLLSLLLKILTHRHQDDDMALLYTAFDLSSESALHSYKWVLLRLAELKGFAHSQNYRSLRSTEESMLKVMLGDMQNLLEDHSTTADARDAAGYVLVEIINIVEVSQSSGILHASVETAEAWCQQGLEPAVLPEHSALSCVLVKLKCWSQLKLIPRESHLSCGYHLSRAGVLDQAEQFLQSGLGHPSDQTIRKTWSLQRGNWRYDLELLTVIMRSGRWSEAQSRLIQISGQDSRPVNASDASMVMGDYGEFALTTACLMADCYVAKGFFNDAELLLRGHLESIIGMRDDFIRTTRVSIISRLLNVQLQLPLPGDTLRTALLLRREVEEPDTFPLEPDTIEWIVQELLACINRLVSAEQYVPARKIITQMRFSSHPILKNLFEGSDSYLTDKALAIDLALAIERGLGESAIDRTSKAGDISGDQITEITDPAATKKDSSKKRAEKSAEMKPLTKDIQKVSSTLGESKAKLSQRGGRMQDPEKQQTENLQRRKTLFKKANIISKDQRPSPLQNALNMLRLVRLESPPTNKPVAATEEKKSKAELVPIVPSPPPTFPQELSTPNLQSLMPQYERYGVTQPDRIMEVG